MVAIGSWMMAGRYDLLEGAARRMTPLDDGGPLRSPPLAALVAALLRVPNAHRGARPRQVVVAAAAHPIWSSP